MDTETADYVDRLVRQEKSDRLIFTARPRFVTEKGVDRTVTLTKGNSRHVIRANSSKQVQHASAGLKRAITKKVESQ